MCNNFLHNVNLLYNICFIDRCLSEMQKLLGIIVGIGQTQICISLGKPTSNIWAGISEEHIVGLSFIDSKWCYLLGTPINVSITDILKNGKN